MPSAKLICSSKEPQHEAPRHSDGGEGLMSTHPNDDRAWGSEKVRGMLAARRWSDEEIARYVGTHSAAQVRRIRLQHFSGPRPTSLYLHSAAGNFDEFEMKRRRERSARDDQRFLKRLREVTR